MPRPIARLPLSALTVLCLGCTPSSSPTLPEPTRAGVGLNSDMIRARFGSYAVDVRHQTQTLRVSELYSGHAPDTVTRTLAIVEFSPQLPDILGPAHRAILAGGSIGSTLQQAGWQVLKTTTWIGDLPSSQRSTALESALCKPDGATLAAHRYRLRLAQGAQTFEYATITEIHHSDYLGLDDLEALYGSPVSDGSVIAELKALFQRLPTIEYRALNISKPCA